MDDLMDRSRSNSPFPVIVNSETLSDNANTICDHCSLLCKGITDACLEQRSNRRRNIVTIPHSHYKQRVHWHYECSYCDYRSFYAAELDTHFNTKHSSVKSHTESNAQPVLSLAELDTPERNIQPKSCDRNRTTSSTSRALQLSDDDMSISNLNAPKISSTDNVVKDNMEEVKETIARQENGHLLPQVSAATATSRVTSPPPRHSPLLTLQTLSSTSRLVLPSPVSTLPSIEPLSSNTPQYTVVSLPDVPSLPSLVSPNPPKSSTPQTAVRVPGTWKPTPQYQTIAVKPNGDGRSYVLVMKSSSSPLTSKDVDSFKGTSTGKHVYTPTSNASVHSRTVTIAKSGALSNTRELHRTKQLEKIQVQSSETLCKKAGTDLKVSQSDKNPSLGILIERVPQSKLSDVETTKSKEPLLSPIRRLGLPQFSDALGLKRVLELNPVNVHSKPSASHRHKASKSKVYEHARETASPYQRVYKTTANRVRRRSLAPNNPFESPRPSKSVLDSRAKHSSIVSECDPVLHKDISSTSATCVWKVKGSVSEQTVPIIEQTVPLIVSSTSASNCITSGHLPNMSREPPFVRRIAARPLPQSYVDDGQTERASLEQDIAGSIGLSVLNEGKHSVEEYSKEESVVPNIKLSMQGLHKVIESRANVDAPLNSNISCETGTENATRSPGNSPVILNISYGAGSFSASEGCKTSQSEDNHKERKNILPVAMSSLQCNEKANSLIKDTASELKIFGSSDGEIGQREEIARKEKGGPNVKSFIQPSDRVPSAVIDSKLGLHLACETGPFSTLNSAGPDLGEGKDRMREIVLPSVTQPVQVLDRLDDFAANSLLGPTVYCALEHNYGSSHGGDESKRKKAAISISTTKSLGEVTILAQTRSMSSNMFGSARVLLVDIGPSLCSGMDGELFPSNCARNQSVPTLRNLAKAVADRCSEKLDRSTAVKSILSSAVKDTKRSEKSHVAESCIGTSSCLPIPPIAPKLELSVTSSDAPKPPAETEWHSSSSTDISETTSPVKATPQSLPLVDPTNLTSTNVQECEASAVLPAVTLRALSPLHVSTSMPNLRSASVREESDSLSGDPDSNPWPSPQELRQTGGLSSEVSSCKTAEVPKIDEPKSAIPLLTFGAVKPFPPSPSSATVLTRTASRSQFMQKVSSDTAIFAMTALCLPDSCSSLSPFRPFLTEPFGKCLPFYDDDNYHSSERVEHLVKYTPDIRVRSMKHFCRKVVVEIPNEATLDSDDDSEHGNVWPGPIFSDEDSQEESQVKQVANNPDKVLENSSDTCSTPYPRWSPTRNLARSVDSKTAAKSHDRRSAKRRRLDAASEMGVLSAMSANQRSSANSSLSLAATRNRRHSNASSVASVRTARSAKL